MHRLTLPTRERDCWTGDLLDNMRPMRLVTASGGFLAAAGVWLFMQRPGDLKTSMRRVLDEGMGVTAIAVEPWRPYRYAIATKTSVNVYPTDPTQGPIMELHPKDPEKFVTHLAFAKHEDISFLYFRVRYGALSRVRMTEDVDDSELVEFENASAIASDEHGALAVLDATQGNVYVTSPTPGKGWDIREGREVFDPETKDDNPDEQFQLAICDGAVAFTSPGEMSSAHVSWGPEHEIDWVSITCNGPIAFADKDTLLLSDNCENICKIACVPREGDKHLIAEVGCKPGQDAPVITSMAFDTYRRNLWCMSREFGMYRAGAPKKKGDKTIMYS